jgi:hypothetical protein
MVLVLVLLAAALIVALILWLTIGHRSDDAPSGASTPPAGATGPPAAGPVSIAGVTAYDPAGDGEENNEQAAAALADGDPSTNWKTVCYLRPTMSKAGVGLVVTLSAAGTGTLSFDVGTGPFEVEVFGVDTDAIPSDFSAWGSPLQAKTASDTPGTVSVATPVPVRHLLIALREVGRDPGCSAANPNRGSIGEVRFG